LERFPSIDDYAHEENWVRAIELSEDEFAESHQYIGPLLCIWWNRIDANTAETIEKWSVLMEIKTKFNGMK
jgi:hypothetical protein